MDINQRARELAQAVKWELDQITDATIAIEQQKRRIERSEQLIQSAIVEAMQEVANTAENEHTSPAEGTA